MIIYKSLEYAESNQMLQNGVILLILNIWEIQNIHIL